MSVQLEKNKIIITIPSNNPESDLQDMQKEIILLIQNFDPHLEQRFYQAFNLLEALIPDNKTFEIIKKEVIK